MALSITKVNMSKRIWEINIIKKKKYELNYYARQKIECFLELKSSKRAIAKKLGKDHSVIIREINRNKDGRGKYSAKEAQRKTDSLGHKTNTRKLETNEFLRKYVENKMMNDNWSPEQIAGKLRKYPPKYLKGSYVCLETIYDFIYRGNGKYLYHYLKKAHPHRKKWHYRKKHDKIGIKERVSIHDRPVEINERKSVGHWESDLIIFRKQKDSVSVQYERKLKLMRMHKIINKTAEENYLAITDSLISLPRELKKSMTFDNGKENICHQQIKKDFEIDTYFCDPYASWQKGGVENTNGLIRYYLPKNADLSQVSDEDIYRIQELINNRPRKCLNYLTPNEVFKKTLCQNTL